MGGVEVVDGPQKRGTHFLEIGKNTDAPCVWNSYLLG